MLSKLISTNTDVKSDEKHLKDITAWNDDMEGHAKMFVERYCELAHKTVDQLHKVSTPCLDQKCVRVVRDLLSDCADILVFGKN